MTEEDSFLSEPLLNYKMQKINKKKKTEKKEDDEESEESNNQYTEIPVTTENKVAKKDPTTYKKIALDLDFYSQTWYAIKKETFEDITIRGVKISLLPQDYFSLYIQFIIFVCLILVSIILIVQEALIDDVYVEGDFHLTLLRMMLVIFTQMNLGHELEIAYAKFLYPIINKNEFYHPNFAIFIGFCHCLVCITTILGLLVFICMADEFADPVINFAGITVLSELDNWVGDAIMTLRISKDNLDNHKILDPIEMSKKVKHKEIDESDIEGDLKPFKRRVYKEECEKTEKGKVEYQNYLKEKSKSQIEAYETNDKLIENHKAAAKNIKEDREKFSKNNLNERLSLRQKLALISEDIMEIYINEEVYTRAPFYIVWFEKLFNLIPWMIVLPLATVPLSKYLPTLTKYIREDYGLN